MIAVQRSRYWPDIIGLITLMVLVAITSTFIPESEVPRLLWIPIYAAWAVGAMFVWRRVEANQWPTIGLSSVGGAVLWYVVTRAISRWTFGTADSELSKVFDLLIALIVSPGLTFVAIAGWMREFARKRQG